MNPELTYVLTTWDGNSGGRYSITFEDKDKIPRDVRIYPLERESREWFRVAADLDSEVIAVEEIRGHLLPMLGDD